MDTLVVDLFVRIVPEDDFDEFPRTVISLFLVKNADLVCTELISEASVLSLLSPIIVDILLSTEFVWVVGVGCERVPEIPVLVIHVGVFCVHFTALIKK